MYFLVLKEMERRNLEIIIPVREILEQVIKQPV